MRGMRAMAKKPAAAVKATNPGSKAGKSAPVAAPAAVAPKPQPARAPDLSAAVEFVKSVADGDPIKAKRMLEALREASKTVSLEALIPLVEFWAGCVADAGGDEQTARKILIRAGMMKGEPEPQVTPMM